MAPEVKKERVNRGSILASWRADIRPFVLDMYRRYLNRFWGMDIAPHCAISLSAKLDKTFPKGLHIGEGSAVNFGAVILTHDYTRKMHAHTRIGRECLIGAHSVIMPGITIGDGSVVSVASVVMRDVPPHCLVAGNPARVMDNNIKTTRWGQIVREPLPTAGAEEKSAGIAGNTPEGGQAIKAV